MIRTLAFRRSFTLSHAAAAALALGVAGGAMVAASPALAASGPSYSKPFIAVAGPLQAALGKAKGQDGNAAVVDPLKTQLDAAIAAATNPDDKFAAGQLGVQVGTLAKDTAIQRKGVQMMIDSGKAPADLLPKLEYYAGQFAYQAKDYAGARAALQAAITAGYHDNDVAVMLAESYLADNQAAAGLDILQKAIEQDKAAGVAIPEAWYRRGLGAAYTAKLPDKAGVFALGLVQAYPSKGNWAAAIDVVRDTAHFPAQDELDLMRLMRRTASFAEVADYAEYVQSADARRLPGEVKAVIDAGVAAGQPLLSNTYLAEAFKMATGRIPADKASLSSQDRDAHAAGANAATVAGAGDAFLSYDEAGKALELYKLALGKPGVDMPVVLTRLGIAQVDTGDFAGAQDSFGKVTGPRQPLAKLWIIYAQQKAAGK